MLSFIPIIGPILSGLLGPIATMVGNYFSSKTTIATATISAEVEEAKVSAGIIHDTQDDVGLRLMRDLAIFPVVVWMFAMGWDTVLSGRDAQGHMYHQWAADWIWHTPDYPTPVGYIPYAVIVFLFGNIGLNIWKRK